MTGRRAKIVRQQRDKDGRRKSECGNHGEADSRRQSVKQPCSHRRLSRQPMHDKNAYMIRKRPNNRNTVKSE